MGELSLVRGDATPPPPLSQLSGVSQSKLSAAGGQNDKPVDAADATDTVHTMQAAEAVQAVADLTKLLSRALRALGNAGQPDAASRLAAQAWLVVRGRDSVAADRLSGLLHYLARLEPEDGAAQIPVISAGIQVGNGAHNGNSPTG